MPWVNNINNIYAFWLCSSISGNPSKGHNPKTCKCFTCKNIHHRSIHNREGKKPRNNALAALQETTDSRNHDMSTGKKIGIFKDNVEPWFIITQKHSRIIRGNEESKVENGTDYRTQWNGRVRGGQSVCGGGAMRDGLVRGWGKGLFRKQC